MECGWAGLVPREQEDLGQRSGTALERQVQGGVFKKKTKKESLPGTLHA
jgi:hypothetical protein